MPGGYKLTVFESDEYANNLELFTDLPAGAVILIDECWKFWKAGTQANTFSIKAMSFFTEHRHRVADGKSQQIILICQDLDQVAKPVQSLVSQTYRYEKMDTLGLDKIFQYQIHKGPACVPNPPVKNVIRSETGLRYDPEVFKYYKSHTLGDGPGDETKIDKRGRLFAAGKYKYVIPVGILLFGLGIYITVGYFKGDTDKPIAKEPQHEPVQAHPTPTKLAQSPPAATWRFAGIVTVRNLRAAIIERSNEYRYIKASLCRTDIFKQYTCTYDEEQITQFTGSIPDAGPGASLQFIQPMPE